MAQSFSRTCNRSRISSNLWKVAATLRCKARSPSVTMIQLFWCWGSRRRISACTWAMKASLLKKQAGPHSLLLGSVIVFGGVRLKGLGKQTLDHRLGCPDVGFLGKHGSHGGHAFFVSLFSPSEPHLAFPRGGLDHRHALAIDGSD